MNGVANGLPALAMSGWKFADLNGDHRDDLVSYIDILENFANEPFQVWVDANTGAGQFLTNHNLLHERSTDIEQ